MIFLLISNVICFMWPLFLTLKLLNGEYHKKRTIEDKNSTQVKFLLNYWICYIAVDQIEGLLLLRAIFWPFFGFSFLPELLSCSIKVWLFYNHGCLVINYCYLDNILRNVTCLSEPVDTLGIELHLANPKMKTVFKENYVTLLKLLPSSENGVIGWTYGRPIQFLKCFIDQSEKSLLQFSLEYICYMDSKQDLEKNFDLTKKFISSAVSLFQSQLSRFNIQEEKFLPGLVQLVLISNRKDVQLQHNSKHKSSNDRNEPATLYADGAKTENVLLQGLDYKSRSKSLDLRCSANGLPGGAENCQFPPYTLPNLQGTSSKPKYINKAIFEYVPSTISNSLKFRKLR